MNLFSYGDRVHYWTPSDERPRPATFIAYHGQYAIVEAIVRGKPTLFYMDREASLPFHVETYSTCSEIRIPLSTPGDTADPVPISQALASWRRPSQFSAGGKYE